MKTTIKNWSEDDRPREKLLQKSALALSDSELIAILIRSGSHGETAVELAQRILARYDNDLSELARVTVEELMKYKGIGEAKAVTVKAALELTNRRKMRSVDPKEVISTSNDAFELISPYLRDKATEEFWVFMFDRRNRLKAKKMISSGGVSATVVDPKIVFKYALEHLASGIIVAHNHPSGNCSPGQNDINLTSKLTSAGELLDIQVLDHLIIAGSKYYSFRDENRM